MSAPHASRRRLKQVLAALLIVTALGLFALSLQSNRNPSGYSLPQGQAPLPPLTERRAPRPPPSASHDDGLRLWAQAVALAAQGASIPDDTLPAVRALVPAARELLAATPTYNWQHPSLGLTTPEPSDTNTGTGAIPPRRALSVKPGATRIVRQAGRLQLSALDAGADVRCPSAERLTITSSLAVPVVMRVHCPDPADLRLDGALLVPGRFHLLIENAVLDAPAGSHIELRPADAVPSFLPGPLLPPGPNN
ncbi:MAG: hypothetical protein PF961_22920 [Planctomycetota bacterium]|nr:hypothetical protein [Planctomycetota bacterium]